MKIMLPLPTFYEFKDAWKTPKGILIFLKRDISCFEDNFRRLAFLCNLKDVNFKQSATNDDIVRLNSGK